MAEANGILESIGLRRGEGARTGRLFGFILLLTLGVVLAKSAQRGIFLGAYPRTAIPDAFLLSAGVMAVTSFLMSALAPRLGLLRLVQALLLGGAAVLAISRIGLDGFPHRGPMVLYVVVETLVSLLLVQGWAVVSEVLDVRSAKRLVPLVGVGAGLAWTGGGLAVAPLARWVGAPSLLVAAAILLVCAFVVVVLISARDLEKRAPPPPTEASLFSNAVGGLRYVFTEPLMRVLAAIITLDLLVEQITDLQMFAVAQARFATAPDGIAGFMGIFYAVTGAVTLLAPLTFAGRILSRFGSIRSLLAAPLWVLGASGLFLVNPMLGTMVLVAGGDRILKQSLSNPGRAQILGAVPAIRRAQAGAALRGILASAFAVLGATALKLVPRSLDLRWLSLVTAGFCVLLVGVIALKLRASYVVALQRSVDRRRLNLDSPGQTQLRDLDREQLALLTEEIRSIDPDRASFALSILSTAEAEQARPLLHEALSNPSPSVQTSAVEGLMGFNQLDDAAPIADLLERTDDNAVRCACLRALASSSAVALYPRILPFHQAADPRVRALATACLARFEEQVPIPGLPMVDDFNAMLASPLEPDRAAAAWAMGQVPLADAKARASFSPLLQDSSMVVRREAVGAAGWFADLPIIQGLVLALVEHHTATAAFDAFSFLNDAGIAQVEGVIQGASSAIVSRAAAALSRGGGERSGELLNRLLDHPDSAVRHRAARALVLRRRTTQRRATPSDSLLRAIHSELEQGYRYHAMMIALAALQNQAALPEEQKRFIRGEIESRIQQTEERLLALLAVISDRRIARLSHLLRDASPQVIARTVELLEQSLNADLATLVIPFLEKRPDAERARTGSKDFNVPAGYLTDPVFGIMDLNDDHLRRCALLVYRDRMAAEYPSVLEDQALLHLVERIRFLRSVPLFKELSAEDLMKLAEIAEPVGHALGHVIFRKGDPGDVLCVIVRGRVEIRDGEHVIATQSANEFFGELAVLDHEPRSADAVCTADTELLQIGGPDLEELMERRPEIAREIIRVLARRLRRTTRVMVTQTGGHLQPPAPLPVIASGSQR